MSAAQQVQQEDKPEVKASALPKAAAVCPKCGGLSAVVESRVVDGLPRRRRQCVECSHLWPTIEVRAHLEPGVPVSRALDLLAIQEQAAVVWRNIAHLAENGSANPPSKRTRKRAPLASVRDTKE